MTQSIIARPYTRFLSARFLVETLFVAVVYALLGKLGQQMAIPPGNVTPVWPPSGFALAMVFLIGNRAALGIVIGAFAINTLAFFDSATTQSSLMSLAVGFSIALGSVAQPLFGAFLLKRFITNIDLTEKVQTFLTFVAIVPVACLVSSSIGASSLFLGDFVTSGRVGELWLTWWLGDGVGILIFCPLILAWHTMTMPTWRGRDLLESAVIFIALVLSSLFSFGTVFGETEVSYPLLFLNWPCLLWLALRRTEQEVTVGILALSAISIGFSALGRGPFFLSDPNHSLLLLQVFLSVTSVTVFVIFAQTRDRRAGEAQLHEAMKKEQLANRAKSDLLANMSHELRTPLNAIIGFSDSLRRELFGPVGSEKNLEYINDINTSGAHLLDLISDILDISAVEAGKLELFEERLDLHTLADTASRLIRPRCNDKGIILEINVPHDIPNFFADERRIKQILINLLANAVKFTPRGGHIIFRARVDGGGSLRLEVEDTGMGMDDKGISVALSQFGRADSSHVRAQEGAGLGLYLTNRLVGLHGGTLGIRSEIEKGTVVSVHFPASRVIDSPR